MLRSSTTNHIEIDLESRLLFLFKNAALIQTYPVAIGKEATPTPRGIFKVVNKKIIRHPSVFGSRWIGIDDTGYGIHGTNNPALIGKAVSNGCIRMYNSDVEAVFAAISIGSQVRIY